MCLHQPGILPSINPCVHRSLHPPIYESIDPCAPPSVGPVVRVSIDHVSINPCVTDACLHQLYVLPSINPCVHLSMHPSNQASINSCIHQAMHPSSMHPSISASTDPCAHPSRSPGPSIHASTDHSLIHALCPSIYSPKQHRAISPSEATAKNVSSRPQPQLS